MNMRRELPRLHVVIYCDGSCLGNGTDENTGGWAARLIYGSVTKDIAGSEFRTTNNRMELKAAINALSILKFPCSVTLYSDSQYLVRTMNDEWKRRVNLDLWEQLDRLNAEHTVKYVWVKGHADDPNNEFVNSKAQEEARKLEGDK
jgi:ribonuclease HI